MYLSRISLDLRDRQVQKALEDPYRLHQGILCAFPPTEQADRGRVLFRVEPGAKGGTAQVLVQSAIVPDWASATVRERLPIAAFDPAKELPSVLEADQTLRFRLRGNPTRRSDGKRLAVTGSDAQLGWLRRKLEVAGFELVAVRHLDEGLRRGARPGDGRRMTFVSVLYDGMVRVRDPDRALAAIRTGIGSAKAFGFGLLSIARA